MNEKQFLTLKRLLLVSNMVVQGETLMKCPIITPQQFFLCKYNNPEHAGRMNYTYLNCFGFYQYFHSLASFILYTVTVLSLFV